jgi:hypothetical protein
MEFKVAFNDSTKIATLLPANAALPAGSVSVGTFKHAEAADLKGSQINHVYYHHIQDLLLKHGVQDMLPVEIVNQSGFEPVLGIFLDRTTAEILPTGTLQIGVSWIPSNPTNKTLTYVSSDPTAVTVSSNGLVTAVAPTGVQPVTVTVKTAEGGFTAKLSVIVNEPNP